MANHPSDPDAASRGPGEQARHAEPPGWEQQHGDAREGRAPDATDASATATVQIPAAQQPPAPVPWSDGWATARPAGAPGHGHDEANGSGRWAPPAPPRPEDGWSSGAAAGPGGFPGWASGPAGPTAWYGTPPPHPPEQPGHRAPEYGAPFHTPQGTAFGPPLPPAVRYPEPPGRSRSGSRGTLIALGLVAVLLAGVLGGVVGSTLAGNGRGGSIGVLGVPLPEFDGNAAPTTPVEAVAARVLPSVVQLRVDGPSASGEGSAMVLSADGLLLTNNHVVEEAAEVGTVTAVFQDGTTAPALIVGRDPSSDLAVIRAQNVSGLAPVELGNSDSVRVGQQVVAFGAPLGLGGTVTTGIISAVDRAVNVGEETGANTPTVLNALQTDAAINPGNSGGPLVDMDGRVVGINSAIATTGAQGGSIGVGFSIPINQARRVAEELERTGRAARAILGVTVADDPQQAGAVIRGVTPGGAAEQAGIRVDDIVLRFGDQRISTGTDLQAAVGSRAPGEVVEVQLADRTVQATLTAAPN